MRPTDRRRAWAILLGLMFVGGCQREPLEQVCTPLLPGDLVITELRNRGGDEDVCGMWVELHNPTDFPIAAAGLFLELNDITETKFQSILVRDAELTIEPGGYVVLGGSPDAALPEHMDYSFETDFTTEVPSWYTTGKLVLSSCDVVIDEVKYWDLPEGEALIFDGDRSPDTDDNYTADVTDPTSFWCVDRTQRSLGACDAAFDAVYGTPGTPGAENPTCASQPE